MLAGEQRRGHDNRHLTARHGDEEGRAQGHFRLAEADVAAHQPVHRPAGAQILEHRLDGVELVLGLLIRKTGGEFVVEAFGDLNGGRGAQRAGGGCLDQAVGDLADALLHARLARLPGTAAQPVELGIHVFRAVAGFRSSRFSTGR